jgi:phage virion morphogenesis protein
MAGYSIKVKSNTVDKALQKTAGKLSNLKPVFGSIGEYMLRATRSRFDAQADPNGRPWAPLRPATIKAKERRKFGTATRTKRGRLIAKTKANPTDILHDTFTLRDTINYQADGQKVLIGSPLIKARSLQLGYPKRNLPARPFLGVSKADEREIVDIVKDFLQ